MKAFSILILLSCFISATQFSFSQNQYYRVFFKTKGPESFFAGTDLYNKTLASLSQKSLDRRKKFNGLAGLISIEDAPVYSVYVDSVLTTGVRLHHTLKWQNYIVVEADSTQMATISKFSFVKSVQPTSSKATLTSLGQSTLSLLEQISNCGNYRYGSSFNQISMMNLPILHSMGFSGTHSTIGVLDNGFIWRNHLAFKHLKRIKEYDFIYNDTITSNESNDVGGQDDHGTVVLGSIAGYLNDSLIGSAPFANYYLCKTEDNKHERRIEEDHYAAAIEWLEAEGVDISTSSLGYFPYDGTEELPTYSELDGKTTIASKVVNTATKKGMICITAAGNSGSNFRTIISPGDADSVFTVGAVNPEGNPAGFTSRGPLENGKIKPDFAAQGVQVFTVSPQSTEGYTRVNGTSFATPLFAGAVGVLSSAFPELPPYKIRAILKESSSQYSMPDSILGFGVPDMVKAFKKSGISIAPPSYYPAYNKYQRVVTNIVSDAPVSLKRLHVLFDGENEETIYPLVEWNKEYMVYADIPLELFKSTIAKAYITTENANFKKRYPFGDSTYFEIQPNELSITCGVNQEDLPVSVNDAYTSMVVPSVISYDNYATTKVITMVPSQEALSISIFDILGNEVSTVQLQQPTIGLNWIPIQTSSLSSGLYLIVVKQGARTSQASFIINR
ncbi:MAG: S8 family peptidase [Candidatus Kapabacteria bacterium]|nr:S8 family peptidase [Candidatus Kapabacteria bacterium]